MSRYTADRNVLLFKIDISTDLLTRNIMKLRASDVKGKSNFKIREGKTKKETTVYLSAIMANIADYTENLQYLFGSRKGNNHIVIIKAYRNSCFIRGYRFWCSY